MHTKHCLTNLINMDKNEKYWIAFAVLEELKTTPTNMGTPLEEAIMSIPILQSVLMRKITKGKSKYKEDYEFERKI